MDGAVLQFKNNSTVLELFEEQVRRTPDSIAIVYGEEQVSFRTLNERANQLARFLLKYNISHGGREYNIAVCMERSPELFVSIFGILKAGASYVPIDPSYPKKRQQYMLDDSKAILVLTRQKH